MSLVISKKRNFSKSWLPGFSKTAKINEREHLYLSLLIELDSEKNESKRNLIYKKIKDTFYKDLYPLEGKELYLISSPKVFSLYNSIDLKKQGAKALWYKKSYLLKITAEEVKSIFSQLKKLGLIFINKKGLYAQSKKFTLSKNQKQKLENFLFHKQILKECDEVLENYKPQERSFGSLTIATNEAKLEAMKKEIEDFGLSLMQKYQEKTENSDHLVRVNLQLYPIFKTKEEN